MSIVVPMAVASFGGWRRHATPHHTRTSAGHRARRPEAVPRGTSSRVGAGDDKPAGQRVGVRSLRPEPLGEGARSWLGSSVERDESRASEPVFGGDVSASGHSVRVSEQAVAILDTEAAAASDRRRDGHDAQSDLMSMSLRARRARRPRISNAVESPTMHFEPNARQVCRACFVVYCVV